MGGPDGDGLGVFLLTRFPNWPGNELYEYNVSNDEEIKLAVVVLS